MAIPLGSRHASRGKPQLPIALLAVALLAGCATEGARRAPETGPRLEGLGDEERAYLAEPLTGYPLVIPPEAGERLRRAHRALLAGQPETARRTARELLAEDPGLHPARVLVGQADLAAGEVAAARDAVASVAAELPGYVAAQLLLGRAAERLGEIPESFAAFRAIAGTSSLAAERAGELRTRALEIVANRARDALDRGRLDGADEHLATLEQWGPDHPATLGVAADLARARGNRVEELAAVRQLTALEAGNDALLERRANLELDVGNPGTGLELFRRLAERRPEDPSLDEKLAYAKFRWRLTLLPDTVQEVARVPELERGDLAVLLYWLVPAVRYGEGSRPRIAADILDDPRREEIARVINQGLMDVNETLHEFSPTAPLARADLLESLLAVLAQAEPPVACVRDLPGEPVQALVCETASRCGLLPRPGDCLPEGPVSGRQALELIRRTLEILTAP